MTTLQKIRVHRADYWAGCDHISAIENNNGVWRSVWVSYEQVDNGYALPTSETASEEGLQRVLLQDGRTVWVQSIDLDYLEGVSA